MYSLDSGSLLYWRILYCLDLDVGPLVLRDLRETKTVQKEDPKRLSFTDVYTPFLFLSSTPHPL